ncbi:hypothetical protein [Rhodoferax sp. GW822-FHT02A01]|uniref:hypothetical protein n=1 Tax=Rhodoferax sp. GW822-FHT02A01 TaxID=3141537 RepID=UPI00315CB480
MSIKNNSVAGSDTGLKLGCLMLAVLASSISVAISVAAGWQRGATNNERLLMASVGFMAVLGAHFLPAFCRYVPTLMRVIGVMIWLICCTFVSYGHASFFLLAQDQAGAQRAATLIPAQLIPLAIPKRTLSTVLADEAKVKGLQAADLRYRCTDDCSAWNARQSVARTRMAALEAEADEIQRWQLAQDKVQIRRDELRDDAVTTPLAASLHVTNKAANTVMGGVFSLILEGLGCFCWYLVFLSSGAIAVTQAVTPGVTDSNAHDPVITDRDAGQQSEQDELLEDLWSEYVAGRIKCTVDSIRKHLKCGQKRAAIVRHLLSEKITEMASVHAST